jgi:hypothetical protein
MHGTLQARHTASPLYAWWHVCKWVKPPRPEGRGFAARAYAPGKEDKHSCIAPLDPALKDGRSALRQHFVRGEQAGQNCAEDSAVVVPVRKYAVT